MVFVLSIVFVMIPTFLLISILVSCLNVTDEQQITEIFQILSLSSLGYSLLGVLILVKLFKKYD